MEKLLLCVRTYDDFATSCTETKQRSLTLGEQYELKMCGNKVLRKVYVPKKNELNVQFRIGPITKRGTS